MRRAGLAIVLLAACGPRPAVTGGAAKSNTATEGPTSQPVGRLPVDFVVLELTAAVTMRADASGLTELHRVELPDAVDDMVWRTPDELFLSTLGGQVFVVRGGTAEAIALPPPEAWALPNPEPGGDIEPVAMEQLYADKDGNVWLGRCQWGDTYDGGHCAAWSYARIAPGAAEIVATPAEARGDIAWIKPTPEGYRVAYEWLDPEAPPEDSYPRLRCTGGGADVGIPDDETWAGEDYYGIEEGPWVAHDPPMFLVGHRYPGLADLVPEWRLYRACEADPIARLAEHSLGPAGVWAYASDEGGWRVMLDGKELGVLPDNLFSVTFAPPRP